MPIQKHIEIRTGNSNSANIIGKEIQSPELKTIDGSVLPEKLQTTQLIFFQWVEKLITAGWGHRQRQKKNRSNNKLPKDPRQRKEAQKKRKKKK